MTAFLPAGSLFQSSDDRRKAGAHYTPRSLTQPIVATTLAPVLARLSTKNGHPAEWHQEPVGDPTHYRLTPEQILNLKICDPAVGSGAFLVEVCEQLAAHLLAAWARTGTTPEPPAGTDLATHARRLVARRCLYGIDKNPRAVDLAKLSLWLLTFVPGRDLVFLDHCLRSGDALVGLSREQIERMTWEPPEAPPRKVPKNAPPPVDLSGLRPLVEAAMAHALTLREQLRDALDDTPTAELRRLHEDAEQATAFVRFVGDLVIGAYFSKETEAERWAELERRRAKVAVLLAAANAREP